MDSTMALRRPLASSPRVLAIARATGSIITVAAVLDIHMDTNATARMKPRIKVVGFLPILDTMPKLMRLCRPCLTMEPDRKPTPTSR